MLTDTQFKKIFSKNNCKSIKFGEITLDVFSNIDKENLKKLSFIGELDPKNLKNFSITIECLYDLMNKRELGELVFYTENDGLIYIYANTLTIKKDIPNGIPKDRFYDEDYR